MAVLHRGLAGDQCLAGGLPRPRGRDRLDLPAPPRPRERDPRRRHPPRLARLAALQQPAEVPDDPGRLAQEVVMLLGSESRRAEMGRQARAWAERGLEDEDRIAASRFGFDELTGRFAANFFV